VFSVTDGQDRPTSARIPDFNQEAINGIKNLETGMKKKELRKQLDNYIQANIKPPLAKNSSYGAFSPLPISRNLDKGSPPNLMFGRRQSAALSM